MDEIDTAIAEMEAHKAFLDRELARSRAMLNDTVTELEETARKLGWSKPEFDDWVESAIGKVN